MTGTPSTDSTNHTLGPLRRHFVDLRDGTHGDGAVTRNDKEKLFRRAVELLDPHARQALTEVNDDLLLGTGTVTGSGPVRAPGGGSVASWTLAWPRQRTAKIRPITVNAFYGLGFHHPHLQGGTVGEWPLNVFDADQAAAELPTLRTIVAAELHNLVFQRDFRIVPVIVDEEQG